MAWWIPTQTSRSPSTSTSTVRSGRWFSNITPTISPVANEYSTYGLAALRPAQADRHFQPLHRLMARAAFPAMRNFPGSASGETELTMSDRAASGCPASMRPRTISFASASRTAALPGQIVTRFRTGAHESAALPSRRVGSPSFPASKIASITRAMRSCVIGAVSRAY